MNLPEDTVYPRNITELRRALNASRSRTDRTVYVTAFKTRASTNTRDLQVKGPANGTSTLTVVNAAGFNDLHAVSGRITAHLGSAWGNPLTVEPAADVHVTIAPGTKATISGTIPVTRITGDLSRTFHPLSRSLQP